MTDDNETMSETPQGDSRAGEQTSRLRAELSARREASAIVAEANRISDQAAAEAESMVAEAEALATSLVAEAEAEAEQLRSGVDEERRRIREEVAAEVRAEMSELRARVEQLLADIGGDLADLGSLLTGAHSTVQRVQRTAEGLALVEGELQDSDAPVAVVAAPCVETERDTAPTDESEHEDATQDQQDDEPRDEPRHEPRHEQGDREPVVAADLGSDPSDEPDADVPGSAASGESRESLYAVTVLHDTAVRDGQPAESKDDLDEAPSDPRPLGWLFRGH